MGATKLHTIEQPKNESLGTAPIGRLLARLALPTVAAQLINMLYNIVDRIYIGHMHGVGDLALTGVGVCLPLIMIVSAFAALIGAGGAPRASIFMGKGDNDSAERIMNACFTLQVLVSVVLTAILLFGVQYFLSAFGASENTLEYAVSYMQMYAIGTVFVQLTLGMNAYITAQGRSSIAMLTVLIGAVLNIALDPLFLFVLDMGVQGAALATILSQAVSCAWVLLFLCGKKTVWKLRFRLFRIPLRTVLPCLALGLAPFIMQASESFICICFNASLLKYGGDIAVGAMTILSSVMQFAMLPLQGVAQGAQPILGYNYGAKNRTRVKRTFRLLLIVSLVYSFTLWAAIMAFPRVFASIFTPKPDLINFSAAALRIYCAVLCIFGVQVACQMTFVSLGKAGSSILVAVARKFLLLLPLIYLLPLFVSNRTMAVYLAEPVADVLAVSFTAVLFLFQFRRALREMDSEPSDAAL